MEHKDVVLESDKVTDIPLRGHGSKSASLPVLTFKMTNHSRDQNMEVNIVKSIKAYGQWPR